MSRETIFMIVSVIHFHNALYEKPLKKWHFEFASPLVGDNYKWWWQNPNIGDHHGCLVDKYKPFGKKFSFLALKKPLNPSAQDLKMQWEINLLTLLNMSQNATIFF